MEKTKQSVFWRERLGSDIAAPAQREATGREQWASGRGLCMVSRPHDARWNRVD